MEHLPLSIRQIAALRKQRLCREHQTDEIPQQEQDEKRDIYQPSWSYMSYMDQLRHLLGVGSKTSEPSEPSEPAETTPIQQQPPQQPSQTMSLQEALQDPKARKVVEKAEEDAENAEKTRLSMLSTERLTPPPFNPITHQTTVKPTPQELYSIIQDPLENSYMLGAKVVWKYLEEHNSEYPSIIIMDRETIDHLEARIRFIMRQRWEGGIFFGGKIIPVTNKIPSWLKVKKVPKDGAIALKLPEK